MSAEQVILRISELCKEHNAQDIYLFGSRAKNCNLDRSDIDIAVRGADDFEMLRNEIDDIQTLFSIDLINLDTASDESLLEDIYKYGRKI